MMMNDRRKTKNREFKRRQRKGRKGNKKTKTRAYALLKKEPIVKRGRSRKRRRGKPRRRGEDNRKPKKIEGGKMRYEVVF